MMSRRNLIPIVSCCLPMLIFISSLASSYAQAYGYVSVGLTDTRIQTVEEPDSPTSLTYVQPDDREDSYYILPSDRFLAKRLKRASANGRPVHLFVGQDGAIIGLVPMSDAEAKAFCTDIAHEPVSNCL
jgi:hypothetical protein